MYKKDIYLDIDDKLNSYIKSVELDSNSRVLHFHLTVDYSPLDLTGKTVQFRAEKPDKTNVLNDCKIIDAKNGIVKVELTQQINAVPGHVYCLLKITGSDGYVLKTKTFIIEVSKTLGDEPIVSSNEFRTLDEALEKVRNIDQRFAETNAQMSKFENTKADKSVTSDLQSQINSLVLESSGDSNLEVVQARGSFSVLNERFVKIEKQVIGGYVKEEFIKSNFYIRTLTSTGTITNTTIRICNGTFLKANKNDIIKANGDYKVRVSLYSTNEESSFIRLETFVKEYTFEQDCYFRLIISKDDESTIQSNEIDSILDMIDLLRCSDKIRQNEMIMDVELERFGLSKLTGLISNSRTVNVNLLAFRTGNYIDVGSSERNIEFDSNRNLMVFEYDANFNFVGYRYAINNKLKLFDETQFIKLLVDDCVPYELEDGSVSESNGLDFPYIGRLRTGYINVNSIGSAKILNGTYQTRLYDSNYNYIGVGETTSSSTNTSLTLNELIMNNSNVKYIRFIITKGGFKAGFSIVRSQDQLLDRPNVKLKLKTDKINDLFVKNNKFSDETFSFNFEVGEDYTSGLLQLPQSYSNIGNPTRLIIFCHGSSDYSSITTQGFGTYSSYIDYLVDEGYAVFDVYTWTSKYQVNSTNLSTPIAIKSLIDGYRWVVKNFNIATDGVFITCKSAGGCVSTSLAYSKSIPVIALGSLAPALLPLARCYGYEETAVLASFEDFGFIGDSPFINYAGAFNGTKSNDVLAYFKTNLELIRGLMPFYCGLLESDDDKLLESIRGNTLNCGFTNFDLWEDSYRNFGVPVKIWIAEDDEAVSYNASKLFIRQINNAGGIAQLRTMPNATGGHHAVDNDEKALKVNNITTRLGIEHTNVPLAYVELIQWFRRFE